MMARSLEYFEFMHEWAEGAEYDGFTVAPPTRIKGLGSDGIFTLACEMRGAVNVCTDIYENPRYVHDLLDYIADSVISRIRRLRSYFGRKWPELGQHVTPRNWGFGDDSIQLISTSTLKEFVLPRQKRLLHALAGDGPHSLHLCGDAMRHLPTLVTELNMGSFDTGFPMNFDWVRENVGADIEIVGGPDVMGIHAGPRESIVEETRRILVDTSIRQGGRFIAREANSVVPGTPIENVETVYDAVRRFGVYPEGEWDSSATPPNSASVAVAQPAFAGIGAALVGMEEAGSDR
jgi:hypothetical protein